MAEGLCAEDAAKVAHVRLEIGDGQALMGSDTLEAFGHKTIMGNNVYTSIEVDDKAEVDRLFAALSDGGVVEMKPSDMPWGAYWCSFADRFGVGLMVSVPA